MSEDGILAFMGLTVIASLAFTGWTAIHNGHQGGKFASTFRKCLFGWVSCALLGTGIGAFFALDTFTFLSTMPFVLLGVNAATGSIVLFCISIVRRLTGSGIADGNQKYSGQDLRFEDSENTGFILHKDKNVTALVFFMWVLNGQATHGRILEISRDKLLVSSIRKIKRYKSRSDEFQSWYHSGDWRMQSKAYDPNKISNIRLISEQRYTSNQGNIPPFNVIVIDYGKNRVELNYEQIGRWFKFPVGHADHSQDYLISLRNVIAEEMKERFSEAPRLENMAEQLTAQELQALSEEHGIEVTFGDDPDNSTSPKSPPSSEGKKSTSDDPF